LACRCLNFSQLRVSAEETDVSTKDRTDSPAQRFFGAALVAQYRPDVPITELGGLQEHVRGGSGEPREWHRVLPMWWSYKNPVGGREPELLLPDCVPCEYASEMSMAGNGHLLPSTDAVRSED
jgi:hypothetical protein